jgi:simple sugar transport system ATP-binding protein
MPEPTPEGKGEIIAQAIGVTRSYPGVTALDTVDFEIAKGEVRALLGQNGAGKSTLIRLFSGVEMPSSGRIVIDGHDLADGGVKGATEHGVATCYQELSLVASMTVAENFFLGRWPHGRFGISNSQMTEQARATLAQLGSDIDPNRLAGSLTLAQQQIVEIARALRDNPRLLILDEPTSALASAEVSLVLDTVKRVSAAGVAVIYVSHRMDEIRQIAHTATVMRNGKIIETFELGTKDTPSIIRAMIGTDPEAQRPMSATAAEGARRELLGAARRDPRHRRPSRIGQERTPEGDRGLHSDRRGRGARRWQAHPPPHSCAHEERGRRDDPGRS